jgi:hypothetical protein
MLYVALSYNQIPRLIRNQTSTQTAGFLGSKGCSLSGVPTVKEKPANAAWIRTPFSRVGTSGIFVTGVRLARSLTSRKSRANQRSPYSS